MSNSRLSSEYQKFLPELRHACEALGVTLKETQYQQLLYYLQQLLFWNTAYNLTAIKDPQSALVKHIFDSLAVVSYLPQGNLLDVGTGAGLPSMVIAICQPERAVVALDSNSKKIRFIKQVASEIGLKNITPVAGRIEEHSEKYTVVTSRAFASLPDFVQAVKNNLAPNGEIWAMKGILPQEEIDQLKPDWQISSLPVMVPKLDEIRHLVILK